MLIWDLLIAVAYFAIPIELIYCFFWYPFPVRAGPAVICTLFVSFITLCGGTHLVRPSPASLATTSLVPETQYVQLHQTVALLGGARGT